MSIQQNPIPAIYFGVHQDTSSDCPRFNTRLGSPPPQWDSSWYYQPGNTEGSLCLLQLDD